MVKELKVTKINQGTVIDHLKPGSALSIVEILNLETSQPLIIAMNVESSKHAKKDVIKIEDKFLSKEETDKISLIAAHATINIIEGQKVSKKRNVRPPDDIKGLLICPNKECITNIDRCESSFKRTDSKYKCHFCERLFDIEDFKLR